MGLLEYKGSRGYNQKPLLAMMAVNLGFASSILFAWTVIAVFVAEPISWATWAPLPHGVRPDLIEYPFVFLWALPMAGFIFAWIAKNLNKVRLAFTFAFVPIMFMSLIFTYFYFAPPEYL